MCSLILERVLEGQKSHQSDLGEHVTRGKSHLLPLDELRPRHISKMA